MPENATKILLALGLVLCPAAALSAQGQGGGQGGGPSVLDHDIGNQSFAVAQDALVRNTTGSGNTAQLRA